MEPSSFKKSQTWTSEMAVCDLVVRGHHLYLL